MKLLLDTNVLIPSEPFMAQEIKPNSPRALKLQRLANANLAEMFVHPQQVLDIEADADPDRRKAMMTSLERYQRLKQASSIHSNLRSDLELSAKRNDKVDLWLIDSLLRNAVNFVVSEDQGLHKRARKFLVGERVLTIGDAVTMLEVDSPSTESGHRRIMRIPAYILNIEDPIWDTFRADYPGFDVFLAKCQSEHRVCFVIGSPNASYEAVMILKNSHSPEYSLETGFIKICSLKVDEHSAGQRYGELLLKQAFEYAREQYRNAVVITVKSKQESLLRLLDLHGFKALSELDSNGDLVLLKRFGDRSTTAVDSLESYIEHGPFLLPESSPTYLVPIRPSFADQLFPELAVQGELFQESFPHGNSIRKAYLSNSPIEPPIPGSVLFFYRSEGGKRIVAAGVVEKSFRSGDAEQVVSETRFRTVFSQEQIKDKLRPEVLVILFRAAVPSGLPLRLDQCKLQPPQSIQLISKESKACLFSKILPS